MSCSQGRISQICRPCSVISAIVNLVTNAQELVHLELHSCHVPISKSRHWRIIRFLHLPMMETRHQEAGAANHGNLSLVLPTLELGNTGGSGAMCKYGPIWTVKLLQFVAIDNLSSIQSVCHFCRLRQSCSTRAVLDSNIAPKEKTLSNP